MKVLIVDDTQSFLLTTGAMVKARGDEVMTARSGREALALFARDQPDLVLLDVIMPEMDGFAVARELRAMSPDVWIPIIFLTGLVSDEDLANGIAAGGDDYLVKPVSQTVLGAKLDAMRRIAQMRTAIVEATAELEIANSRLVEMANVDGLTGIANRRRFDETLNREWSRSARTGAPLSLLLIDVDHFKQYNDRYGHIEGDSCLCKVANACQKALTRATDLIARYGGEEFAAILPDTPKDGAEKVADRLREFVASATLPQAGSPVASHVTVSIGCAALVAERGSQASALVETADKRLYEAKSQGRNRVCSSG